MSDHNLVQGFFWPSLLLFIVMAFSETSLAYSEGEDVDNLTLGVVQRKIDVGMSTADVIEALGSPNIISTDGQRREVWVYDKISTSTASKSIKKNGGLTLLLLGASAGSSENERETSQKNLTVIIKFDKESLVRDFSYRQSTF